MKSIKITASLLAIAMSANIPAVGQESSEPVVDSNDDPDIVVTAERIRGQVDTDLPPVLELDEAEIKAFGADSIADLVAQLTPQVSSGSGRGGGRPIFLVNGQRVSSFREFSRYPPEAIRKVEVLPEEVALQYGFSATQRVINFILKDDFASREVEVEYGGPTAGGRANGEIEGSLLTINGSKRFNIGAEFNTSSLLTEDERGIIQTEGSVPTVAGDPDPARFRSLASDSESLEVETTYNTSLGPNPGDGTISFNGKLDRRFTRSLSGLDTVLLTEPVALGGESELRTLDDNPLERLNRTTTLSLGSSVNKPLGDWDLTATLDANQIWSDTDIDRRRNTQSLRDAALAGTLAIDGPLPQVLGAGRDRASSRSTSATSLATLRGTPILLPAGEMNVTFDAGYAWNRIASEDTRSGLGETVLKRGDLSAGVNVGVPVASANEGFLEALGEVNLNLGAGINELSDFGTLTDWNAGLTWRPSESLSLQATYSERDAAPGLGQLGDPEITTFNVPIFDLTRNETVLASVITGGNPFLAAEKQRDLKLGAYYDLETKLFERANIQVEYFRNRSRNVTEGFPVLTPAVEAAFPDRIERDANDRLVSIDRRPITFAQRNASRLRFGINLSGRVGKPPAEGAGGRGGPGGPPPGAGGAQQGGSSLRGPGGGGAGGAQFDPARFAQLREQFCALEDPTKFDFSQLPEQMRARLLNESGEIDPERVKQLQQRFCSGEGGPPGGGFDPDRMAQIREAICKVPEDGSLPDLSALPEQMLERLRGPDGEVDPEKLAALRERMCSAEGQQAGSGGEQRGGRGGGGGRRGGGFGPGGRGDGQGRWFLALNHTYELENEALVAPGVPIFDLLDGDALGSGGVPRHQVQLEGGLFHKGYGLRLSGRYRGESRINGTGLPGSTDLFFNDIVTFDARLFVDLEQQKWLTGENEDPGFWKGARVSLRLDNLFDAQQRVTDQNGTVPLSFQPGLIDPLGRTIEVEFRKIF